MAVPDRDRANLWRLRELLARARPLAAWSDEELAALPRLYRHACSTVARLEASGGEPALAAEARRLMGRAHEELHRGPAAGSAAARLLRLFVVDGPRAIRAEWRLLGLTAALLYGLALCAAVAVTRDLDLAPSLLAPEVVEREIEQLEETPAGEPFRGNFTFGPGESPATAGWILVHNMGVGVLFFASALLPPLYLYVLASNGLMLGTYTAVAGHWGQAGAISSILWCHGVLEIQAILLAGAAGLCLVRAWVRPGPRTRGHALALEGRRALELFLPAVPLLFVAGLIEGYVSPHAPPPLRVGVAAVSAVALAAYVGLAGRRGD